MVDMAGGLIGVSLAAFIASASVPFALLLLGIPAVVLGLGQIIRPQPLARQER